MNVKNVEKTTETVVTGTLPTAPAKSADGKSTLTSLKTDAKPATDQGCLSKTWETISKFFKNLWLYIKFSFGFGDSSPVDATPKKHS